MLEFFMENFILGVIRFNDRINFKLKLYVFIIVTEIVKVCLLF